MKPEDFVTINAVSGDDLMWRWEELKNKISVMTSRTELTEDYFTGDQRWGFDEALSRIENIMEKLEEK
jgi:ribosome assembly protein YihI (activator of Der GTPase)